MVVFLSAIASLLVAVSTLPPMSSVSSVPTVSSASLRGHRRLLETASEPASPANTANTANTANIIEGGVSVKRCVESNVLGLYSGSFLLPEVFEVVQSMSDCCALCSDTRYCAAWDYCTEKEGCKLPEALVKQQSPLQKGGSEFVIPMNGTSDSSNSDDADDLPESSKGSTMPFGACVPTSRLVSPEVAATKENDGKGARFGFFSATVDRLFLPYLSGFSVIEGKNISAEYDFPCGYSPREQRCEIIGTIPEVAAICSADPRCKGFVYSDQDGMGVLKGGEGTDLFSGEDFDDAQSVVYALTLQGQQAAQGQLGQDPTSSSSSSSPSNLWIILISVLGGVAILSIAAVILTMIILSKRCDKLQKSSESYLTTISEGAMLEFHRSGSMNVVDVENHNGLAAPIDEERSEKDEKDEEYSPAKDNQGV